VSQASRRTEFKGLSARAAALLAGDENLNVDFKESPTNLDADDFVQFANSPVGGALLIGVRETKNERGNQRGQIRGCSITDKNKLMLLAKASSCVPPIHTELFVENTSRSPFYRVEIPSGPHKPYCTSGGTYKIRENGRKQPLNPPQLLQLFLDTQAGEFLKRFSQATKRLEEDLTGVSDQLAQLEHDVQSKLEDIFYSATNASSLADEAMSNSDDARSTIETHAAEHESVPSDVETTIHKVGLLLNHFSIEDLRETQLIEYLQDVFSRAPKPTAEDDPTETKPPRKKKPGGPEPLRLPTICFPVQPTDLPI
jgi:ATP-dependent DNA helicase RecG